jgi:uncharacterized membrane protein YesL
MFNRISNIFDPTNSFYEFARKLIYVLALNIIFIITSIPIVTIGTSMTAMNTVFLKIINEKDFSILKDYFSSFKANFIKSTIVWLAYLVIAFILYVDIVYWVKYGINDGTYGYVMLVVSILAAVLLVLNIHTAFPLISRFEMSIKDLFVYTFIITLKNILYAIEGLIFTVVIVGISIYMILTGKLLIMIYMLFLSFGLNGLVQSYIYRRVLNRYSEDYEEMVKRNIEDLKKEGFVFDYEDK